MAKQFLKRVPAAHPVLSHFRTPGALDSKLFSKTREEGSLNLQNTNLVLECRYCHNT